MSFCFQMHAHVQGQVYSVFLAQDTADDFDTWLTFATVGHQNVHTHTHTHTHTHLCVCCLWVWAFAVLVTLCFFTLTSSSVFGIWTPGVSTMWVCAFPNGQAWLIKLMDGRNHWHSTYYTILLVCFLVQNLWRLQLRGSHVLVVGCPYSVFCK